MDDAPKKLWLLWREGGYVKGRVVASEVDHDDEGFPSYVPTADLERVRREARVEGMRAALAIADQMERQNGPLSKRGFPEQYRKGLEAAGNAIANAIRALIEAERGKP